MKILYVEDNSVNLSLIERIAQMNKHDLISFEEAEAALEALEKGEHVDLILLDIQLAGEMDGIAFAKVVRSKGWKQPIIAITAYAMMGDKERIIAAGCNEYLPKPLPIAEFLTLLAKYDTAIAGKPVITPAPANGSAQAQTSKTAAPTAEAPAVEAKAQPPAAEVKAEAPAAEAKVAVPPSPEDVETETQPTRPEVPETKVESSASVQMETATQDSKGESAPSTAKDSTNTEQPASEVQNDPSTAATSPQS